MSKQLSSVVVDDEPIDQIALQAQIVRFPFLGPPVCFPHALEAAEFINRFKPDIVFADIEMPEIDGLQLIRKLHWQPPVVILITSHPEFALEGFELEAFDYLLKPVSPERFSACAHRILNFFTLRNKAAIFDKQQEADTIIVKQGYDKIKLPLHEIHYIEAMKDYVRIVTPSQNLLVLETLAHMQERLSNVGFTRVHRSYLVNLKKISCIKNNKVVVEGTEIPVSKSFKHALPGLL